MKNLKILMVALVLLALPAFAFGQDVQCESCTHQVSVYMGEGGLVATADGEKVFYVAQCNNVTRHGELSVNDDGMVATLLTMDNGLACASPGEKDKFALGPIKDGGWYWITDDMNSAVGGLVAQDILDNTPTPITSAGDAVTMTPGTGAVYMKETASGRVGILPTIVPEPPTPETTKCGKVTRKCMLGDGGVMISAKGPADAYTGDRGSIMDGEVLTRPSGTGDVTLTFDLRPNGTGHLFTGTLPLAATYAGTYSSTRTGTVAVSTDSANRSHGLLLSTSSNVATLTIGRDTTLCPTTEDSTKYTAAVTIVATVVTSDLSQITPSIVANEDNDTANDKTDDYYEEDFTVNVACYVAASSSSSQGVELIPENLFPTDR